MVSHEVREIFSTLMNCMRKSLLKQNYDYSMTGLQAQNNPRKSLPLFFKKKRKSMTIFFPEKSENHVK